MTRYDVDYSSLPEHMRQGASDYIEHSQRPGSFLLAVLQNDLVESFAHADSINIEAMHTWTMWLNNEAPGECWGSKAKVDAWLDLCAICRRRPGEMTIVLDGRVSGLCGTCYERGKDDEEAARPTEDEE